MITLHHLNHSRSQRIVWLLEELRLEYRIQRYERDAQTMQAPPALRAIHPLGKSPVITDGDMTLAESGAIIDYLAHRYGSGTLVPPGGSAERVRYTYWLHYAEGSAMPPLLMKLVFDRIEQAKLPFFAKPIARKIAQRAKTTFVLPQIALHLDYMEAELGKRTWFAGEDFTAADIQMSYPVQAAAARAGLDGRAKLQDYLRRIQERAAYRRALEKGGQFEILS